MNRYQSAFPIAPPTPRDDINYPGLPLADDAPPPLAARTTSRAIVQYEIYVLQYSGRQRANTFIMALGVVIALLATYYLDGRHQYLAIALAVAFILSGAVGYHTTDTAHRSFTRDLAVATSETYHIRPAAPPPAGVRPFVPSANPAGRAITTHTGRLTFTPQVWQALFNRALENGGVITRDLAKDARVGRDWYHGAGWGSLQEELSRLGFIDSRNRLTPAALAWYDAQIHLPLAALPGERPRTNAVRSFNARTNAETPVGQGES